MDEEVQEKSLLANVIARSHHAPITDDRQCIADKALAWIPVPGDSQCCEKNDALHNQVFEV